MNGHRLALRKEWGGGNTDCCFLFEPQLLTQPGNDSRWKDSALAAEDTQIIASCDWLQWLSAFQPFSFRYSGMCLIRFTRDLFHWLYKKPTKLSCLALAPFCQSQLDVGLQNLRVYIHISTHVVLIWRAWHIGQRGQLEVWSRLQKHWGDIFAEGAYFREAFEEKGRCSWYVGILDLLR